MYIDDDEILVTLDVKEMFNNINRDKLLNIFKMNCNEEIYKTQTIIDMMEYNLNEGNMVIYNNKLYTQEKGVPMGAPSSGVYVRIYIDFLLMKNDEIDGNGIRNISKNVDDIFMIVKGNKWKTFLKQLQEDMGLILKITTEYKEGIFRRNKKINKIKNTTP